MFPQPRFSLFWAVLCDKTNPPDHNRTVEYRCETTSVEGFVQLLACNYLPHGYWFYVPGHVPVHKEPADVDAKLIAKYDIAVSRTTRARRKQLGWANVQYLRHGRTFVLLSTHGKHRFFEEEAASIRDIRRVPLKFAGYSISYRQSGWNQKGEANRTWHSHVQIDRHLYRALEAYVLQKGTRRSAERIALEFYGLPFEPYAPVRRQMIKLLDKVNRARRRAGQRSIPYRVLPLRRRMVRPFEGNVGHQEDGPGSWRKEVAGPQTRETQRKEGVV